MRRTETGNTHGGSDRPDPWQIALKQLALRARSAEEIRRSLARRGYGQGEIAAVLSRLTASRYLDDADFAHAWVATRARRAAMGPARLARELRAKGIGEAEITAALRALDAERATMETAREAVRRKLPSLQGLPRAAARRRLAAYLERRGFGGEIILAVCRAHFAGSDASDEADGSDE